MLVCFQIAPRIALAEFDYTLQVGAMNSDNIGRANDMEVEDTVASGGVIIQFTKEQRRLNISLLAGATYLDYIDDTFDEEILKSLDATVDFAIVPDTFSWNFDGTVGQQIIDPLQAVTPGNREDVSFLSSGPELTLSLSNRWSSRIGGRFIDNSYEVRDIDNQRLVGLVAIERVLTENSSLSLAFEQQNVDFDNSNSNTDYDRQNYYLLYAGQFNRTGLDITVGASQLNGVGRDNTEPLFALNVSRQLGIFSLLTVSLGSQFTDAGELFSSSGGLGSLGFGNTQDIIGIGDPLRNRFVSASYSRTKNLTTFQLTAVLSDENFETVDLFDRNVSQFSGLLSHEFNTGWILRLGAFAGRRDFNEQDRKDDDLGWSINIGRRFGQRLEISGGFSRVRRDSSLAESEFEENQLGLRFSYGTLSTGNLAFN